MDAPFDRFGENQVSFVTFNYDRSLEYFFRTALVNSYGKSIAESDAVLKNIPIIHVHGRLGSLIHADAPRISGEGRPFVNAVTTVDVRIAMDDIVIMPHASDESPEFRQAHAELLSASRIFFLGFGYHPSNMSRLRVANYGGKITGGTSKGFGLAEREDIQAEWKVPLFTSEAWATELDTLQFLKNAAHLD